MKIRYFSDTDTALIEFSSALVAETREITENLYLDLDIEGNPVSMTIEHAEKLANISELTFFQMAKSAMENEKEKIEKSYKYQIKILEYFVSQLTYHRAIRKTAPQLKQNFWIYISNNHMEMAVLEWCKLFGANAEHLHWSKVFKDKDGFREHILNSVQMDKTQWCKYWTELTDYRNKRVSHFDPDFRPIRYPRLEPAFKAVVACYQYVLNKLESYSIDHNYPPSLEEYSDRLMEQALVFAERAYNATKNLDEKVY